MTIYRIYKIITVPEYDGYEDDYIDREEDVTIKFVSSKEKADAFLKDIEDKNNKSLHCYNCPIIRLTKRMYNNNKHNDIKNYCNNKDLFFNGNTIFCQNEKYMDFTEYFYEEINVE